MLKNLTFVKNNKIMKTLANLKTIIIVVFFLFINLVVYPQNNKVTYKKEGNTIQVKVYHENGAIAQVGTVKENKLTGLWKSYNLEGKKIVEGKYENGKKTGKWFFWKDNSLREVDFSENKIVSIVVWQDSKLVYTETK